MAESILSELVMNLLRMVGSLHEKNLKYGAQVNELSKELAKARNTKVELEAQILAYQNGNSLDSTTTTTGVVEITGDQQQQQQPQLQQQPQQINQHHQQEAQHSQPQQQPCILIQPQQVPLHHNHQQHQQQPQHHPQVVYQPMAASQSFMAQPQYIHWGYDPTTSGVMSAGQVPAYNEQYYGGAQAFAQHTLSNNSEI